MIFGELQRSPNHVLVDSFASKLQDSFDFVLCIEAAASFENPRLFIEGAAHVLRKGGRVVLADAFDRKASIRILDVLEDNGALEDNLAMPFWFQDVRLGFDVELSMDISRHIHAVGVCSVPKGMSYLHIVAKKE
eukprot:Skav202310  [mRNA]  locus=scaffold60:130185:130766:+ [translate_table: standard]